MLKRSRLPTTRAKATGASQESALHHEQEFAVSLAAFLSSRSENTRRTYQAIFREWEDFLSRFSNARNSSHSRLSLYLLASDLHAAAYLRFLEQKPGQASRLNTGAINTEARRPASSSKNSQKKLLLRQTASKEKRDGLQSSLANATIAKKFAALRRLYRMLISRNFGIQTNPFDVDRISPPPKEAGKKRPTEMIPYEYIEAILEQPDQEDPRYARDRGVLALLFGAGLRRSEIVSLRIADYRRTQKGTPFVYLRSTKAGTDAEQALPHWAAKILDELLSQRLSQSAQAGDYLFVSYRGKGGRHPGTQALSSHGVYHLFRKYCTQADIPVFATPHSARATAITKLLDDGISHRDVQQFSRHASVQMVELYDKRRRFVDENPAIDLAFGALGSRRGVGKKK